MSRARSESYRYIVRSPDVRGGDARVEGTRSAVHDVIGLLRRARVSKALPRPACRCSRKPRCTSALRITRIIGVRLACWWPDRWRTISGEVFARPRRTRGSYLSAIRTRPTKSCVDATCSSWKPPIRSSFNSAHEHGCLLVTCNRDDFIELAQRQQFLPFDQSLV